MAEQAVSLSRIRWRCRRGMLELDLLLQGFVDKGFEQLDETGKTLFIRLLELPDQTLYEYLMGQPADREREFDDVIERIRHTATN